MAQDAKYNGWTNRETWVVNQWLNNDEATQQTAKEICNSAYPRQALEQYVDELAGLNDPSGPVGFTADLLNTALSRVDWSEIIFHFEED